MPCYRMRFVILELTTSANATDNELRRITVIAAYLLSTNKAREPHDNAPKRPHKTKYDRLRYPNNGTPSLHQALNHESIRAVI